MNDNTDKCIQSLLQDRLRKRIVLSILNRAREAGIPDKYLRINKNRFRELLCNSFISKGDIEVLSESIYSKSEWLLNIPFIVVDGGISEIRKQAGFAILFRIIAYEKSGYYTDCNNLMHKLQSINVVEGKSRNDFVEELKGYDALFLSEVPSGPSSSWTHFEVPEFFDEILNYRMDYNKITIVSFAEPISNDSMLVRATQGSLDSSKGKYLTYLYNQYKTTPNINIDGTIIDNNSLDTRSVLRIRVKKI